MSVTFDNRHSRKFQSGAVRRVGDETEPRLSFIRGRRRGKLAPLWRGGAGAVALSRDQRRWRFAHMPP